MKSTNEREFYELRKLMTPGFAQDERFVDELRKFVNGEDCSQEFLDYFDSNKELKAAMEKHFRHDELGQLLTEAKPDDWHPN